MVSKSIPLLPASSHLQEHVTCSSRPSSKGKSSSNPADTILNPILLSVCLSKNLFCQPLKSYLVCCPSRLLALAHSAEPTMPLKKCLQQQLYKWEHLLLQAYVWAHSSSRNPRNRKSCRSQLSCHHQNGFWIQIQRWHLVWSCTFWPVFPEFLF